MKVLFTTGNFDLTIEGELNDEQKAKAQEAGLRWITQRDVASDIYKQIAGVKNSKGNLALPEGFERTSVEYNAENAEMLRSAAESKLGEYGDFQVSVAEHVAGETTAPRAMATAMWESKVRDNPLFREQLGIAPDATDDAGIEACHKFLAGFRKQKAA